MGRLTSIITRARDSLSDHNAERWSDDRLLRLIDEGQKNIAHRTQCLRTRDIIPLIKQQSLYTLPTDLDRILRVLIDKEKISLRSRAFMDEKYGFTWEYDTTDQLPYEAVFDKTNRQTLTLYPISEELLTKAATFDSDFGVTTTITDHESSSDYGLASHLDEPVTEETTYSSDFGIIAEFEDIESAMVFYYSKIPAEITLVTDELEIDPTFDIALKYFVVGICLRDDLDAQNRTLGNEALQFYASELTDGAKDSAADFISSSDEHNQGYQPGI